jgi:hypothetical protein
MYNPGDSVSPYLVLLSRRMYPIVVGQKLRVTAERGIMTSAWRTYIEKNAPEIYEAIQAIDEFFDEAAAIIEASQ